MSGSLPPHALRERITLEQPILTPDGQGGFTRSWQALATVWAQVTTLSTREAEYASGLQMQARVRALIRPRTDLTPAMRAVWHSVPYAVRSITPAMGRETVMEIILEQGGEV
jgi:SPP1 family predicted phage head-tail adaptor